MKKTFYRPSTINCKIFNKIINDLEKDLATIKNSEIVYEEIKHYASHLVQEALPLETNPKMMFWGFDKPKAMPSDSRILYFYTPTYLVVTILANIKMRYPEISYDIADFDDVLGRGLRGTTGRKFSDDSLMTVTVMNLFLENSMFDFITLYPDLCVEFTDLFKKEAEIIVDRYKKDETFGFPWGEDYSNEMKAFCDLYKEKYRI